MQPTNVILDRIGTLLAADATTLAPAALATHVHLIREPFTPDLVTDFTTLTPADFDGYAAKSAGVGAQQYFEDPSTGNRIVQLLEPAGGWHWETTGVTNLPQTIYGFVVTDNADLITYGSGLLDSPVELLAANQGIDLANLRFSVLPTAVE